MFRSFITLIFVLFSVPTFSSSFEYRDYGDSKCEMRTINPNDLNLSLVAKMTDESFDEYKSEGTSNFENNMHRVKDQLSRTSGQCLKFDGDKSSCQLILDKIGEWQEKQYLITQSPFDSANWWEEAHQVANFHHTMLETLSIASRQLNIEPSENIALSEWVNKSITKSSKVDLSKGNHRTAWFLAAAKAAEIFDRPLKVGFNMLSAEELIEEELEFQFNMQRADGSLPEETKRGRRAIYYTGREISFLMALMEMGENLGLESYKKYGNKLHLAVGFMLDAIDDPDKVYPYAKEMKASTKGDPRDQQYGSSRGVKAGTFGFANIYASRFPDHKNVKRMRENKNFIPFIKFDVKIYNAFGIDVGCLNPNVEKVAAPKPINTDVMHKRFACFMDTAISQNLEYLPTDKQVKALIAKIQESGKAQVSRVDLTKYRVLDTMTRMEHMDPILNLLNFEGSLDEFCANPIDRTVVTAPSKF